MYVAVYISAAIDGVSWYWTYSYPTHYNRWIAILHIHTHVYCTILYTMG